VSNRRSVFRYSSARYSPGEQSRGTRVLDLLKEFKGALSVIGRQWDTRLAVAPHCRI
jgi:hypothetical protein